MKNSKKVVVWTLTSIRVLFALIFVYLFLNGLNIEAILIFLLAILTDVMDGYFARKFKISSPQGAYFDILADFILVVAAFASFIFSGIYPIWLLILIILVFIQFIVTSRFKVLVYDPIGKYYGSFMFLMILITQVSINSSYSFLLIYVIVFFTVISLISRYIFFISRKDYKK